MDKSIQTIILFNPRNMRGVGEHYAPPMGLLMSAIHLYDRFKIVIVDQRIDADWKGHLESLLKEKVVCIGITALTGTQIAGGIKASEIAKENGCPVVWGGVHASLFPGQTLANPLVDYVVAGEGEETFAELVDALVVNRPCGGIRGLWFKEGEKTAFGGNRAFVDLDKLPPVPYHLIDLEKHIMPTPYGKGIILYSSRGCPQRCTFCFNQYFNQSRWRAFSSRRTLNDIRYVLKDHPDVTHFEFWDDNFFVDLKRAREIAEGIRDIRSSRPVTWSVLGTHIRDVSRMDEDYLACLKDSGLKEVLAGVESGSQRILDRIRKNFKVEELFSYNRRLADYGIRPTYSFMSGIPGEEDEDIKETIDVMLKLKKENPNVQVGNVKPFMCYPGTVLYDEALKLGFNPPASLKEWSTFVWGNYFNLRIPWVSQRKKRFLTWLYYYTVLMNPEYMFIRSGIFTAVARLLRPISEWRVRRLNFRFPIEGWLMYMIQKNIL